MLELPLLGLVVVQPPQGERKVEMDRGVFWVEPEGFTIGDDRVGYFALVEETIPSVLKIRSPDLLVLPPFKSFECIEHFIRTLGLTEAPEHAGELIMDLGTPGVELSCALELVTGFVQFSELGQDESEVVGNIIILGFQAGGLFQRLFGLFVVSEFALRAAKPVVSFVILRL